MSSPRQTLPRTKPQTHPSPVNLALRCLHLLICEMGVTPRLHRVVRIHGVYTWEMLRWACQAHSEFSPLGHSWGVEAPTGPVKRRGRKQGWGCSERSWCKRKAPSNHNSQAARPQEQRCGGARPRELWPLMVPQSPGRVNPSSSLPGPSKGPFVSRAAEATSGSTRA